MVWAARPGHQGARNPGKSRRNMLTKITLADVNGRPHLMADGLDILRIGDTISLGFRLQRGTHGRLEILDVPKAVFRVVASTINAAGTRCQEILVEHTVKPPVWKSEKKVAKRFRVKIVAGL